MAAIVHEIRQISTHDSYHGWPTVARRRNGELLVVVSAGREKHVCPFGQVHLLRSTDDGATWSQEVLVNGPLDDRDAGIIETAKGTLLVNWFTSIAWLKRLEAADTDPQIRAGMGDRFHAHCQKIRALLDAETIARELSPWMIRSEDGGKTWSDKIDPKVGTPHGPTELADGSLLYVGNLRAADNRPNGSPYDPRLAASLSTDDGRSWSVLSILPVRPGDEAGGYHEPHVVQAANGTIVVHIRNHNDQDKYKLLQCTSRDGGKTWDGPRLIDVFGYPNHLLRLRDGRLLTTYGYRRDPYGNKAAISEDHGQTWSAPMTISAEEARRDIGYPSTVEMADGSLLTVWYEYLHAKNNAVVRLARWTIGD